MLEKSQVIENQDREKGESPQRDRPEAAPSRHLILSFSSHSSPSGLGGSRKSTVCTRDKKSRDQHAVRPQKSQEGLTTSRGHPR